MTKAKGTLIYQGKTHRLIAIGKMTAGYEDIYIVEKPDEDALGGVKWTEVDRWDARDKAFYDQAAPPAPIKTALVEMIKELKAGLAVATQKSEGWDIPVSTRELPQ